MVARRTCPIPRPQRIARRWVAARFGYNAHRVTPDRVQVKGVSQELRVYRIAENLTGLAGAPHQR